MNYFEFFSSNMKKINSARAKFLFEQFNTAGYVMNICAMICKLFASEPSITERTVCNRCTHSNSITYPLVSLNDLVFANDFSNFEKAIIKNFPPKIACTRCKNDVECTREFGPHMFIQVITSFTIINVIFIS